MKHKIAFRISLVFLFPLLPGLFGQVYPLTENSFSNPEFKKRFLGSYGTNTEVEPQITRDESTLLEQVYEVLKGEKYSEAISLIQTSLTAETSAALHYILGNLYFQTGNQDRAISEYERSIEKFPNFLRAYSNLGRVYIQNGEFEKAKTYLTKAIELGGGQADLYGLLGYANLNLGNYDVAIDAYSIARVMDAKAKDWKVGRAQALMMSERYSEAIGAFKELLTLFPNESQFFLNLANAYLGTNESTESGKILEIVRRSNAATLQSQMLLGDIYVNQQLYGLAADVYEEAIQRFSSDINPSQKIRIAKILVERGAFQEAEKVFNQIRESGIEKFGDRSTIDFLTLEAELAFAQGDTESGVAILEELVETDPTNGRALLLLGRQSMASGDYELAGYYFERAGNIQSSEYDAKLEHGRMLVMRKSYTEALPLLRQANSIRESTQLAEFISAVESIVRSL